LATHSSNRVFAHSSEELEHKRNGFITRFKHGHVPNIGQQYNFGPASEPTVDLLRAID